MSTKPTVLPRWADVGGNVVTPLSGKLDDGFVADEEPPDGYLNWLFYHNYLWAEYLNDGAFQGAATFDNTLGVTGLITATAGITCAVNQDATVSGTGRYNHGDIVLPIPPSAAEAAGAGSWQYASGSPAGSPASWLVPSAADTIDYPIILPIGARIKQIDAYIRDTTGGSFTIAMIVLKSPNTDGSTATQIGATQTSAGDGTNQTLSVTSLTETIAAGFFYSIGLAAAGGTYTTHKSYGVDITYDHP